MYTIEGGTTLADDQKTEDRTEEGSEPQGREGESNAAMHAREKEEAWDKASETMRKLEEEDEPPTDLKDWPDDEAKYITYGGGEGDHGYDEGPEKKLGPSSLERHEDGSITIEGKEVDNPEDYKADPVGAAVDTPVPGDKEAPEDSGESDDDSDDSDDDSDESGESDDDSGDEDESGDDADARSVRAEEVSVARRRQRVSKRAAEHEEDAQT